MAKLVPLELARNWHIAHQALQKLVTQQQDLGRQIDTFRQEAAEREKDLRALLDNSTPQRLFQVEAGVVVMVSATRGVEVVSLEAPQVVPPGPLKSEAPVRPLTMDAGGKL